MLPKGLSPCVRRLRDVTAPGSRHSIHVTGSDDLVGVAGWSAEELYRAVKHVDDGSDGPATRTVVIDYGRDRLYAARASALTYRPPRGLGLLDTPALDVADPELLSVDPGAADAEGAGDGTARTGSFESVTVAPEFDVLVPAFDWEEMDVDDLPPPIDYRPSGTAPGAGTGTPG